MEKLPTVEEILKQYGSIPSPFNGVPLRGENSIKQAMIEFANLHLKDQAEYITEQATLKFICTDNKEVTVSVDKQSIITAGEEYRKEIK